MAANWLLLTLLPGSSGGTAAKERQLAGTRTGREQVIDPVGRFFTELADAAYIDTFARESATLRFDIIDSKPAECWHVTVDDANVTVSRKAEQAEAIVRISRPELEAIVTGRLNAQAAILRGMLACQGDLAALMMFQRCLPGPPGSTGRVAPISGDTVMALHVPRGDDPQAPPRQRRPA